MSTSAKDLNDLFSVKLGATEVSAEEMDWLRGAIERAREVEDEYELEELEELLALVEEGDGEAAYTIQRRRLADVSGDFIRDKLREVSFRQPILPPKLPSGDQRERVIAHDTLVKIVDVEPQSRAMRIVFKRGEVGDVDPQCGPPGIKIKRGQGDAE